MMPWQRWKQRRPKEIQQKGSCQDSSPESSQVHHAIWIEQSKTASAAVWAMPMILMEKKCIAILLLVACCQEVH